MPHAHEPHVAHSHASHHASEVLPLVDPHPVVSSVHGDHAKRPDAIAPSHHVHAIRVLAPPHEVLVSHVVGTVVHHEATTLHPTGVAAGHVGGDISTVAAALIGTSHEVPILIEDNL